MRHSLIINGPLFAPKGGNGHAGNGDAAAAVTEAHDGEAPAPALTTAEQAEAAAIADAIKGGGIKLDLPAEVLRRVPWEVAGFSLDPGSRQYDRKQAGVVVGQSLRLANVVCKLKGGDPDAPFYFLANINRITTQGQKPRMTLSLPAQQKGAGSYASAILKTDSAAAKAAQEAWKDAILRGPFPAWLKEQDLSAFVKNVQTASAVGVEMDVEIPGL